MGFANAASVIGKVQHDLLHIHQAWCGGLCNNTLRFGRKLGGCDRCARFMKEPIHLSARRASMPICRTWIHCCPKPIARDLIVGLGSSSDSEKALRVGFADAYICELRGYLGIEEYLASSATRQETLPCSSGCRTKTLWDVSEELSALVAQELAVSV